MICKYFLTRRCLHTIWLLMLTIIILLSLFDYSKFIKTGGMDFNYKGLDCVGSVAFHKNLVDKYYEKRKHWKTSNLGTIMFKHIEPKFFANKGNENFLVLIWQNWNKLVERHVRNYDSRQRPTKALERILADCNVKNCKFSGNTDDFYIADAVIMTGDFVPKVSNRNLRQRWIFLTENSPMRTPFLKMPYHQITDLANVFNWTMTYRSDSDIPIPYGRTLPLQFPNDLYMDDAESVLSRIVPFWSEKQFVTLANILISNCNVKRRMTFLNDLQKHMKVDVHGNCSDDGVYYNSCPRNKKIDCKLSKDYIFYLAFESSSCRQYITEKTFYHAYSKGAIPVIMGPPIEDCEKLLPPNSYLHVTSYTNAEELAAHMLSIAENIDAILQYHAWRTHFKIENEHGYFGTNSSFFCRVCEALNYNDGGTKTYDADDLELYFGKSITCDVKYL